MDNNISSDAQNIEPTMMNNKAPVFIASTSKDGVFSNLNSKPEVIQIVQNLDKPPSYSQVALNMPPSYQDVLEDFNAVEGMLIGK